MIIKDKKLSILDLGCGIHSSEDIYEVYKNHNITGVDIDKENIMTMKKAYPDQTFITADIRKLPFKDKFDIVYCLHVLEHLKTPEMALREIRRVSDKNSRIFLSVPHANLDNILSFIIPGHHGEGKHRQVYYKKDLENLLKKIKLKIISIKQRKWLIAVMLTAASIMYRIFGWPEKQGKEVYYFINPDNQQHDPTWLKYFRKLSEYLDYVPVINLINNIYPMEITVEARIK